jgi:hypothetical protein
MYLLYGLGGSGKSQTAYKFVQESQARKWFVSLTEVLCRCFECFLIYSFSDVFFIDASDVTTIETDLISIAQAKRFECTAKAALMWLRSQSHNRWLIIFNNADDPDLPLRDYLPQCSHANILITSRNPNLRDDLAAEAYQKISSMTSADAKQLLLNGLRVKTAVDAEAEAEAIVKVRCHCIYP